MSNDDEIKKERSAVRLRANKMYEQIHTMAMATNALFMMNDLAISAKEQAQIAAYIRNITLMRKRYMEIKSTLDASVLSAYRKQLRTHWTHNLAIYKIKTELYSRDIPKELNILKYHLKRIDTILKKK